MFKSNLFQSYRLTTEKALPIREENIQKKKQEDKKEEERVMRAEGVVVAK